MNAAKTQKAPIAALGSGILFGFGLIVSGMADPNNVLAFLTLTDAWRSELLVVMGSAAAVSSLGYAWVRTRKTPLWNTAFNIPNSKDIDPQLIAGAVIFGCGWGVSGYCPGPALVGAFALDVRAVQFLIAYLVGALLYEYVKKFLSPSMPPAMEDSRGDG